MVIKIKNTVDFETYYNIVDMASLDSMILNNEEVEITLDVLTELCNFHSYEENAIYMGTLLFPDSECFLNKLKNQDYSLTNLTKEMREEYLIPESKLSEIIISKIMIVNKYEVIYKNELETLKEANLLELN